MLELHHDIIKEKLYFKTLNNGLSVYLMPRDNFSKAYGIFASNYGSIDSKFKDPDNNEIVKVPDGIAHFLEHKLFEGENEDTFSIFARLGASTNAYTNQNTTAYLFQSSENIIEASTALLNFVQEPYFTDENVEKEKGIIEQEIRMYEDDANYQVYFNLLSAMYHKHPAKIDIAGTVESIAKISKEDLYLCYNTFYNPGNMVLFITGDFVVEDMMKIIEENQNKKQFKNYEEIERFYEDEPQNVYENLVQKNMDVSQALFRMGIKENIIPKDPIEMLKQDIASNILMDILIGKGSSLYQELYNDGLIDNSFGHYYVLEKGYGYALLGGKSNDPELLYNSLKEVFLNNKKNIKEDDFKRLLKKNIGEYVEGFNSFDNIASDFISFHFKGLNYFDYLKIMEDINYEYILKRSKDLFQEEHICRSIIERA
ncbi:EF-P 5-aminopentanol modification-associated protein YfmH [Natronospora cellulosivora (SeqCode)]